MQQKYDNPDKPKLLPAVILLAIFFAVVLCGLQAMTQDRAGSEGCKFELAQNFFGATSFLRQKPARPTLPCPAANRSSRLTDAVVFFEDLRIFRILEPEAIAAECPAILPYYIQKKTLEVRAGPYC